MTLIIISVLLFLAYTLLMLVYARGWRDRKGPAAAGVQGSLPSITIVIPARDEAANIGLCLRSRRAQPYPAGKLEILVIDDFSSDDTAVIAERLLQDKGRVLRLAQYLSPEQRLNAYKKKALELAISEAMGDWIITTDADCTTPPHWLQQMSIAMQAEGVQFIAAPGSFTPARKHDILY